MSKISSETILAALSLLICSACVAQVAGLFAARKDGNDLRALCRNDTVKLSRLSHLDALLEKLNDDHGVECLDKTVAALHDLKTIVDSNKGRECSMAAQENFRAFYVRYLDTSDKDKKESVGGIPLSLRQFAIAYGLQLSGLCRSNMVKVLLEDASKIVTKKDFKSVRELIEPEGPIALMLGYSGQKPDEMMLPADLMSIVESVEKSAPGKEGQKRGGRLTLKARTTPYIKRLKTLCERRFAPIYKPVMLPVAKLANLGFNNRKSMLKEILKEARDTYETRDTIGKWTRIVFLCQVMESLELVEAEAEQSAGNDAKLFEVKYKEASREESRPEEGAKCTLNGRCTAPAASESETTYGESDEEGAEESDDESEEDIEQVVFEPKLSVDIPDKIYGEFKQKVAVANVKTDMDEAANIRSRYAMKMLRRFKNQIANRRFREIFKEVSQLVKGIFEAKKKIGSGDVTTDLVKSMNDLIDRKFNKDSAIACGMCVQDHAPVGPVLIMLGVIILFCVIAYFYMSSPAGQAAMANGFAT